VQKLNRDRAFHFPAESSEFFDEFIDEGVCEYKSINKTLKINNPLKREKSG
jgi:hypothetical protein